MADFLKKVDGDYLLKIDTDKIELLEEAESDEDMAANTINYDGLNLMSFSAGRQL